MTTFDRYLLKRFVHVFLIISVSTFGLFVVIDGFSNVDAFQRGRDDPMTVIYRMSGYYLYQSVAFFSITGAILAVISVMAVFAMLWRHREIQPLLAAGVPTYRLAMPLLAGTALVNIALVANQELLLPQISHRLQQGRRSQSESRHVESVYDESLIHISGKELFLESQRMNEAEFLLPTPGIVDELTSLKAREAVFLKKTRKRPSGWLLKDVRPSLAAVRLTPKGSQVVRALKDPKQVFIITDVSADQLYSRSQNYKFVSTPELIRRIGHPAGNFASVRGQRLHLHARLMSPFINLIAVLVVVPLICRKESSGLVANLALCTGVLGVFFGTTHMFLFLGGANIIPTDVAACAPVVLGGTLGSWLSGLIQT